MNVFHNLKVLCAGALAFALLVPSVASAWHWDRCRVTNPTPPDFVKSMAFIMNGTVVPPDPVTGDPGDEVIDPTPFWTQVLGRDQDDIEAERNAAVAFFADRFGLDVDDPAMANSLYLFPFQANRSSNYRAYYISGEPPTAEGWEVVDTGWIVAVVDPAGVTMGGEFAGVHAAPGTVMLYGEYYVVPPSDLTDLPFNRRCRRDPIHMRYQAGNPVRPNEFGEIVFQCDVFHPEWGQGFAQGITYPVIRPDGLQKQNTRNIVTFSGHGDDPVILPPRY